MSMLNEHLEHEIKQRLLADEDLSSQRIEVRANDGGITLMGNVQSFRRKLAAQQIAESSSHVDRVDNQIVVSPPEFANDILIAAQANELLDEVPDLTSQSIRVSVKEQSLALTGYVKTDLEKARVADIAASVEGAVEIDNFLVVNPDQVLANQQHCQKIQAAIAGVIGMEDETIRLSVVNETAQLSGTVDVPWKSAVAQEITGQFGILNISNEIVVRTPNEPGTEPS